MTPRVKVAKGWRFRLILVDEGGRYVFDDYGHPANLLPGLGTLIEELRRKEKAANEKETALQGG